MEQPKPTYRRTQYWVDRDYQIRFMTRMFVAIFLVAVISAGIAMAILMKNMYRPELEQQIHLIAGCIGVAVALLVELLVSIPIVYYLGLRQSHTIVGPLKRIARMLEAVGAGDFSQRITLRKGDALEDMADALNKMAEALAQRYGASR